MEVHAHSHTERKKWTHYFWEFLMLFLAVFAGFLSENQREHYVEHKRAKSLAASLLNDLQKDTMQLNMLQAWREKRKLLLDSFYLLLESPPVKMDRHIFYSFITQASGGLTFSQSTGTISQLKNAGYLRYFNDNKLLNNIADYEFWIQDFKSDEAIDYKWVTEKLEDFVAFNLDNSINEKIMVENIYPEGIGVQFYTPDGLHNLKAIINELRMGNYVMLKDQVPHLKRKVEGLMKYLHDEHGLQ